MKTLTNSGDFTGSQSGTSGNLDSALEKSGNQSSAYDIKKYYRNPLQKCFEFFTFISGFRNNLQNHRQPECRNKHFEKSFSKDHQN
jgi:hypothetical protein